MKKTEGPTCFECSHYPHTDDQASARDWGRPSPEAPFYCPQIRKRVTPAFATHCPEFLLAVEEDRL